MFYDEEKIDEVESIIESEEVSKHVVGIDKLITDEELPSVSEMLEDCISYYRKKSMYISDAIIYKDGIELGKGLAIEVEDTKSEGYYVHSAAIIEDGRIPKSLFNVLRDLVSLDYILRESKDREIIKVELEGEMN
jgi:hypothetical protein